MTVSLARRLVWDGLVGADEANRALHAHVTRRVAFLQALLDAHPELAPRLEAELGAPRPGIQTAIIPDRDSMRRLPKGLCAALLAVPAGTDPRTGVTRILAADASDRHVAEEFAYHLGGAVEVGKAPLRAILAALGQALDSEVGPTGTPAFGTRVRERSESPGPDRASAAPSGGRDVPVASGAPANAGSPQANPSEPPIPLVRVTAELPRAPATVKGVAPQGASRGNVSPVVVPGGTSNRVAVEPVIELTRAKSLAPPATVKGTGPGSAPSGDASAERPPSSGGRALLEEAAPPTPAEESRKDELDRASSPEEVMAVVVRGLSRVARRVLALAVRGKVFEGREANDDATRAAVRSLVISADRPSVLLTAVQTGSYVGPIPETRVHAELARLLGGSVDEIAVGTVLVSGRAAVVYVMAGFDTAYLATRRASELAQAAGKALERIVRERRK